VASALLRNINRLANAGLGLDLGLDSDGHKRLTTGLAGGTQYTAGHWPATATGT
jgi:hypothetical protein